MKIFTFFTLFFVFTSQIILAQNTFKLIYGKSGINELPNNLIQIDNGHFLGLVETLLDNKIISSQRTNDTIVTELIEFTENGEIISTTLFKNYLIKGIKQLGVNYFCYGYFKTDTNYKVLTMILNPNFNIIKENKYILPFYDSNNGPFGSIMYNQCIYEENNKYYCTFSVLNYNPWSLKTSCFVFSQNADSINSFTLNASIYDFCENNSNSGFIISGIFYDYSCNVNGNLQIAYTDTLFNISNVDCIDVSPSFFSLKCNIKKLSDKFIISGLSESFYDGKLLGLGLFDTSTTLQVYTTIGNNEQRIFGARNNGIVIDINSNIFASSTYGFNGEVAFDIEDNYLVLAKTDSLLNKKWEHFIGGDAYYELYDITLCSDGGVILSAIRYDENINNRDYDVCFFKLDSDGNITNIENSEIKVSELILYPNPATDFINIRLGSHLKNVTIEIYDISGKKILSQKLQNIETQINIFEFKTGTYIYKIFDKERIIERGKFLKN